MNTSLRLIPLLLCFLLIGYGISYSQEQTQTQEQPAPQAAQSEEQPAAKPAGELPPVLEAEMTVAEHWSKNPYPRTVSAGSRVHIVEKGDTLWDLAARYLNNPFLWPQIWDANKYIPNAHWIYPGDPIVIVGIEPVTEQKIAEEAPEEEAPEEMAGEGTGTGIPVPEKKAVPIAVDMDLYCSGYLTNELPKTSLKIIGNEDNIQKVSLATGDIVYLNQGEAQGVSPGDEFTVLHPWRTIHHPINYDSLGTYVVQTGRLKIVATQENTSTAQLTYACDATLVDDYLIPFTPKEVPVFTEMPPVDRFSASGGNAKGYVVFAKDDLGSLGLGHELMIDLGTKDGVQVGTRLVLFRDQDKGYENTGFEKDLPRQVLGEMVVFNAQEGTATGRIIQMYGFVQVGDRVEVR